ncbi:MAG TPA: SH3 domain-containing protein [Oceanobacillus sp.]|nr:SH3 domain-containing protein [Oceanobacillus sp.]
MSLRSTPRRRGGGPPAWLVFLVAVALVFGAFYLYQGAQNFIRTGGLGIEEATERAQIISSATAERASPTHAGFTPRPTFTEVPECIEFRVSVPNAIVRETPSENGRLLDGLNQGETVCVLGREEGSEWYSIDRNPETRRVELAFMHETVIEAVNPTLTPSMTPTPLPTVTPAPTDTPSITPPPTDTFTPSVTPQSISTTTPTPEAPPTEPPATDLPVQSI